MPPADENADPILHVHFETDGLYFSEAVRRTAGLAALQADYDEKRARTEALNQTVRDIEEAHAYAQTAYDETEGLVIELVDSAFPRLETAARALAAESAAIQILAAASLEAHINVRAAETMTGAAYKEFERLGLAGKWMLYPQIRGLADLAPGNAAIADVATLVSRRNGLVHPKRERVRRPVGFETPDFLERKNLTAKDAHDAVRWARRAVAALAAAEGRKAPGWLDGGLWSLFRHEWRGPAA